MQRCEVGEVALGRQDQISAGVRKALKEQLSCSISDTVGSKEGPGPQTVSGGRVPHPPFGRYIPGLRVGWVSTHLSSTYAAGSFPETLLFYLKMFCEYLVNFLFGSSSTALWRNTGLEEASRNKKNLCAPLQAVLGGTDPL